MAMETKLDFIKMEHEILDFWETHSCFAKLQDKNQGRPRFRFLDGPITANNPMGIHHAWGRSIKDIALRYKAMRGYSCLYRNGFDTQGLWVEVEVEKELGFHGKKEIEAYGVEAFTKKCEERIERFSRVIAAQSRRLGQWMDWDNSYYTHTDENITAIWHFLKRCHENGWIAKSYRPMPWCPRCGTSLSEHEMAGSHREITHTAVFATARVVEDDYDMLVWTTTPWTLAANAALAVNPELEYVCAEFDGASRPLVLAASALRRLQGERRIVRRMRGSELTGLHYETFFPWLLPQQDVTHTIVPWEDVDADEGSGVVHIAPGCGAEDFALGKRFSLQEMCPIDETGTFLSQYDFLSGITAGEAAPLVFEELRRQGKLFRTHSYTHRYPICWRCKTEVLFRLVQEWSIKTEEIRPRLLDAAKTVQWEPAFIGKRMTDWLHNMGDWNISRKRFYGLPLPFYPCETCGHLTVIGSKDELLQMGGEEAKSLPELHRPWIDCVTIRCPQCGAAVSRVPEVGDVWLDAGIVPYSSLGYFSDRAEWEQNFPAEWVVEMQEQVRLWFYSQLFMSVTLTGRAPYERVQTNNWVLAEDGTKFSKTGFMIRFDEAAEKMGSDAIRYVFAGASTASDVRFGYTLGEEARRKLLAFWNICTFFTTYAELDQPRITHQPSVNPTDRWLRCRIAAFVSRAVSCYDEYDTPELIREFERCVEDVSNWYVRVNRRRFWREGLDEDKRQAYDALYHAIKTISQVMAPVVPFMAESIWQRLVLVYGEGEESVHLSDFPLCEAYDPALLEEAETVRAVTAAGMKLRNGRGIKVKQPLSVLYLGRELEAVCAAYGAVLREELNVKRIEYLPDFAALSQESLALDFQSAGRQLKGDAQRVKGLCDSLSAEEQRRLVGEWKAGRPLRIEGFDGELPARYFTLLTRDKEHIARSDGGMPVAVHTEITPELRAEGMYREILRRCQLLRKEAGFSVSDRVALEFITPSQALLEVIERYGAAIERETLAEIRDIEHPAAEKEIRLDEGNLRILIGSRFR